MRNLISGIIIIGVMMIASCDKSLTIELNDYWELTADTAGIMTVESISAQNRWHQTEVPGSWHRLHKDLLDYQGVVWYRKSFTLKPVPTNRRFLLLFGAVDYLARVYVNREFVGEHEGGYTPFEFDVTNQLKKGINEILVRVMDPVSNETGTEGISYWHIPHGKQNWYVQNSGIWQTIKLVQKPEIYIKRAQITTNINGSFKVQIFVKNHLSDSDFQELKLVIEDSDGDIVFSKKNQIDPSQSVVEITGQVNQPYLWDIGRPNLYTLKMELEKDIYQDRFGFREFRIQDGKFFLNKKPFYMIAALDQDFYPETVYETPSEDYLRDEMRKAKELGLNTLRCHIKIPDPRYLNVADELGLLIWYEIPNWDIFHESVKARSRQTLDAMLQRDWNHPSLVIISLINESWGIDLSQPDQRQWLKNEYDYAKSAAVGRLIVDNSACWSNFHLKTDINDYHTYYSIPENYQKFSKTVREVASRPQWLFSPHGDAIETGDEVLMISEFGNWGLPRLPDKLPFWFDRQFLDDEITMPEGVFKRFENFKYGRIFDSYNDLAETSQRAQVNALKWEIEEIRLQPEIQGYVITEFTDINWECNGLLDMWRNFKSNHDVLAQIQQADIIIPRLVKYGFWDNENVEVQLSVSHYSDKDLSDIRIRGTLNGTVVGERNVSVDSVGVLFVGNMNIASEPVEKPLPQRIKFTLLNRADTVLAQNIIEYTVYPSREMKISAQDSNLLIVNSIIKKTVNLLENGCNVLCIVDSNSVFPADFPFKIISRASDWYDGNWASNLNWVVNTGRPFVNLNCEKSLGFEAFQTLPKYVITEVQPNQFDDVLAGMYVGWLHLNSAYMLQMRAEKGKLILSTFQMEHSDGADPFATWLRNKLIDYIQCDDCQPKIEWKPK